MNVYYQMTKSCSLCKSQQRVFCLMPNKCPIIHLVQLHWMSLFFPKPFTLSQGVWEADKKDEPLWALGLLHWSLLYLSESWIHSLAERKQAWQWPPAEPSRYRSDNDPIVNLLPSKCFYSHPLLNLQGFRLRQQGGNGSLLNFSEEYKTVLKI